MIGVMMGNYFRDYMIFCEDETLEIKLEQVVHDEAVEVWHDMCEEYPDLIFTLYEVHRIR